MCRAKSQHIVPRSVCSIPRLDELSAKDELAAQLPGATGGLAVSLVESVLAEAVVGEKRRCEAKTVACRLPAASTTTPCLRGEHRGDSANHPNAHPCRRTRTHVHERAQAYAFMHTYTTQHNTDTHHKTHRLHTQIHTHIHNNQPTHARAHTRRRVAPTMDMVTVTAPRSI